MSADQNHYATAEECAAVTRQATADETWLAAQLDRIDPHRHEMGGAGDRPALERLAFELRAENDRFRNASKRKPMTDQDTLGLFNRIQLRMRFTDADAKPFASGVASAEFFHGIK